MTPRDKREGGMVGDGELEVLGDSEMVMAFTESRLENMEHV